jgi:hypothetical protein
MDNMTHPTDEELEAMAERLDQSDANEYSFDNDKDDAAAMLRACKGRVRVKPLEWYPVNREEALCHGHWVAPALGGAYHTAPDEDSAAGASVLQWAICHEDFCMAYGGAISAHTDPEAAKAAAQVDYERRILDALEPSPDARTYEDGLEDAASVAERCDVSVTLAPTARIAGAIRAMKGETP